jgi:uncharacterized protein YutE (UPF0331/DUF86 family)
MLELGGKMVDREILERRLRVLADLDDKLRGFLSITEEEFVSSDPLHDLAERYLHLAVECMIDVGNHILADRSTPVPETYREVFSGLAEQGVLTTELASRLQGWAGFRNILVHLYLDIDHTLTWKVIQNDLDDLRDFRAAVADLL